MIPSLIDPVPSVMNDLFDPMLPTTSNPQATLSTKTVPPHYGGGYSTSIDVGPKVREIVSKTAAAPRGCSPTCLQSASHRSTYSVTTHIRLIVGPSKHSFRLKPAPRTRNHCVTPTGGCFLSMSTDSDLDISVRYIFPNPPFHRVPVFQSGSLRVPHRGLLSALLRYASIHHLLPPLQAICTLRLENDVRWSTRQLTMGSPSLV
ncbi:hypothetical protein IW262DRAFT_129150 [Armillaria fumosa]|nr:hypothetical protein IW262DRAFT_129150 [Armillaria fumosa]